MRSAVVLSFSLLAFACTSNPSRCVTGMAVECSCAGSLLGTQICQADGTFSACECGMIDAATSDSGPAADAGRDAASTTDTGPATDAGADGGASHVLYAGLVPSIGPVWGTDSRAGGATGLMAGQNICQSAVAGSDHPCDYEELLSADTAAETLFRAIPAGTTGWVQRTTAALVGGVSSPPGPGGNCNDWTYGTNHTGDGEYVTFATAGTPTYHLDNDTVYEPGVAGVHTIVGDLECGGVTRAILCCNAP